MANHSHPSVANVVVNDSFVSTQPLYSEWRILKIGQEDISICYLLPI